VNVYISVTQYSLPTEIKCKSWYTSFMIYEYSLPKCLQPGYMGAWLAEGVIDPEVCRQVIEEVEGSGKVEDIWPDEGRVVRQVFRRSVIDLTKVNSYPKVEALGQFLKLLVVSSCVETFPTLVDFRIDEAVAQIYPAGTELALGWHRDHPSDKLVVISAVLSGDGAVGFTHKKPSQRPIAEKDIYCQVPTAAGDALVFRANGLYQPEDGSDIRETHAVTKIGDAQDRFTIQYRMGVNAGAYGNTHVNSGSPSKV
jgi:hypothetical protein